MRIYKLILAAIVAVFLSACEPPPTPVVDTVDELNAQRYMGTWHEILRLPHSFQEDLHRVTAEYRLNDNGTFEVTNRGFNVERGEWETTVGKAFPVEGEPGSFTVQFQWPFRGGYNIVELGSNYEYAIVVSNDYDYFWLLSRTPEMPRWFVDQTLAKANNWGFDIERMIETRH